MACSFARFHGQSKSARRFLDRGATALDSADGDCDAGLPDAALGDRPSIVRCPGLFSMLRDVQPSPLFFGHRLIRYGVIDVRILLLAALDPPAR